MTTFVQNFFLKPTFKHPQINNLGIPYLDYLKKVFQDINHEFNILKTTSAPVIPNSVLDRVIKSQTNVNTTCDIIIDIIQSYLSGKHYCSCYRKLARCLNNNKQFINTLWSIPQSGPTSLVGNLYRMRDCDPGSKPYTPKEMFHLPFELRSKASSMRFSKPNTPCLYFADNLFVCDAEIRQNPATIYQASRYEIVEAVQVLNFGYNNSNAAEWVPFDSTPQNYRLSNFAIAWLNLYPIALASAIVSQSSSKAPHEYILPQMLMDYIIKNKYDGIRYLSTKVISQDSHINFYTCWAFPTTSKASKGHDPKLCSIIKVSDPVILPVTLSGPMGQCAFETYGGMIRNNRVSGLINYKNDPQTRIFAEAESELFKNSTHKITP